MTKSVHDFEKYAGLVLCRRGEARAKRGGEYSAAQEVAEALGLSVAADPRAAPYASDTLDARWAARGMSHDAVGGSTRRG